MLVALILALIVWSSPAPNVWVCNPGKTPNSAPSNCERLHFSVLSKTRF